MHGDTAIDIPLENVQAGSTTPQTNHATFTQDAEKRRRFGHRRHKKSNGRKGRVGYDGEEDTINKVGLFYKKILDFSIITRYFVYVLPLALCIAVPIIVGATVAQGARIGGVPLTWFFVWVEISMASCL